MNTNHAAKDENAGSNMNNDLERAVSECAEFDPRTMYLMFLVGATEGRDVPPDEMARYGEWQQGNPPESGQVIFDGDWEEENFYGDGPVMRQCSGVSFAWFHAGNEPQYEMCHGPVVDVVRQWMPVPWVPEVWEKALTARRADNARRGYENGMFGQGGSDGQ